MHEPDRPEGSAPALIIVAGGDATRLGPIGYAGKPLVSLGDRPAIIHQLVQARSLGIKRVMVVTPPGVIGKRILRVASRVAGVQVARVEQARPLGPAHAVLVGSHEVWKQWKDDRCLVMFADTIIGDQDIKALLRQTPNVAAVSRTNKHRAWCVIDARTQEWMDGVLPDPKGSVVAVGAYLMATCDVIRWGKDKHGSTKELGMAPLLNALRSRTVAALEWTDIGDIAALIEARRVRAISRPHHNITVDRFGYVQKSGSTLGEHNAYAKLRLIAPEVMPEILRSNGSSITMRHCAGYSLADLMLYHDIPGETWKDIVGHVIDTLDEALWTRRPVGERPPSHEWKRRLTYMYWDKPIARLHEWDHPIKSYKRVTINGVEYEAGDDLIDAVGHTLVVMRDGEYEQSFVPVHGDLNFMNIFMDLQSGRVTLIDPRPQWGPHDVEDRYGDLAYEMAKLKYSRADHFCEISHDLHRVRADGHDIKLQWGSQAMSIGDPLDLITHPQLNLIRATILLSAMPLHPPNQALALYAMGLINAKAGLSRG